MSISYNRSARDLPRLHSMNIHFPTAAIALLLLTAVTRAAEPSRLAPLDFLTAHEWEAKLPDSPDGKKMSIRARFTWAENKQAIRISNQRVIDGKPQPYIEGVYFWNPE